MKNQFTISVFALGLIIILFANCRRDNTPNTPNADSFSSLIVDDSFDWSLTREITVNIAGVDGQVVTIADQYDEIIFHKSFSDQTVFLHILIQSQLISNQFLFLIILYFHIKNQHDQVNQTLLLEVNIYSRTKKLNISHPLY